MGLQKYYDKNGGFTVEQYYQVGPPITTSNGVEAKIVAKIGATPFVGLPTYSKTSEVYLKANSNGNVVQARIYRDRKPVCDFDWDHAHRNADGEMFEKGVVHVQEFKRSPEGKWERQGKVARYMTDDEIARYGELLRKLKPDIRFRP
jgi:hypothetical protein